MAEAFRATASATGALASFNFYVDTGTTATRLLVGIYSNSSGHPGTLLAQTTLNGPVTGWNTVPLSGITLQSGTIYWMSVLGPDGKVANRDVAGGGLSETSASTTLTALPPAWVTGHVWTDGPLTAWVGS